MSALDLLKAQLAIELEAPLARTWSSTSTLDSHIARLQRHLRQGAALHVPRDLQQNAIRRFWDVRDCEGLRSARLLSFGIAVPVDPQRLRIIEDEERFPALLRSLEQFRTKPREFRRCYQGLLTAYFSYDPDDEKSPPIGRENWVALRSYLKQWSGAVLSGSHNPRWAESLQNHTTLFDADPCDRYGPLLLANQATEVDELRQDLGISDSSWFMRKLYIAQVKAATQRDDREYLHVLPRLLILLQENAVVRDEGFGLLLNRFADINPRSLNVGLRDSAVSWWGNPWLQSNAMRWGRVTPDARAMVVDWLKLEFIEAFFTILAEERSGDGRRLAFWRRYVNKIDTIHFALGWQALRSANPDFLMLRKKMDGLLVSLRDPIGSNNAFIMRMGRLVIVEFSGYSNALYGYDSDAGMPFSLDEAVTMPVDAKNSLKHSKRALWLNHQDGILGYANWEDRFAATLSNEYGIHPENTSAARDGSPAQYKVVSSQPIRSSAGMSPAPKPVGAAVSRPGSPSPTTGTSIGAKATAAPADRAKWMATEFSREALAELAALFAFRIEDLTKEGGNLWVRTTDRRMLVNDVLHRWGFRYKDARKGWWVRGK